MDEKVQISTNWCLLRGKNILQSLVVKISENENFETERPKLDDIVSFEQSIHLQQPPQNEDDDNPKSKNKDCEIFFKIKMSYMPNSLTLVTDCQTIELFINMHREYYNTYVGDFIDDFDGMRVYRFDVNIPNNVSNFIIKTIPREPELWIYGIQVNLKTNSAQITGISSLPGISVENVKSILSNSNHRLTPKAEDCKSFVEHFLTGNENKAFIKSDNKNELTNWPAELEILKSLLNKSRGNFPCTSSILDSETPNIKNMSLNGNNDEKNSKKLNELMQYIDKAVLDMENRINLQLRELEKRQNEKLDKIIEILTVTNNIHN